MIKFLQCNVNQMPILKKNLQIISESMVKKFNLKVMDGQKLKIKKK